MSFKKKTLKWIAGILAVLSLLCLITVLFINYELKKMYGGETQVVDSGLFLSEQIGSLIIENVNLLSPEADTFLLNQSVRIQDGQITEIGDSIFIPDNSTIIDGKGKYLIPGLIDAHVHLWQSPNDLLLYLANGITSVRELKGGEHHLKWRNEISEGERVGPNLFVASSKFQTKGFFEGAFLHWMQGDIILDDPNKATSVLSELKAKGYDAIKIGTFLSPENYKAVSEASAQLNIPMVGHLPYDLTLEEFYESNISDAVHLEEFVKHLNREFGYVNRENVQEFLDTVKKAGTQIGDKLAEADIAVTTTLRLVETFEAIKDDMHKALNEVELSYANPGLCEGTLLTSRALGWLPKVNPYRREKDLAEDKKLNSQAYWSAYAEACRILLQAFNEAGVTVLAGTDANLPIMVPGFSLHDELKSLSQAGMSNAQILRSATVNPARRMNAMTGVIAPGYQADLVLLNSNPLENIDHTQDIHAVVRNGGVYHREKLDNMLNAVAAANDKSRKISIDQYRGPIEAHHH